jgi:signal transduction histidine kinase/ActR/RegA family two-component response regulator
VSPWFSRLPIHRKLMMVALVVTTAALLIATVGLVIVDAYRLRTAAIEEAIVTAQVMAENTAATVAFDDPETAAETLSTLRAAPNVRRACLYKADRSLFAAFTQAPGLSCPPVQPAGAPEGMVSSTAPVMLNQRALGMVYVERDLDDLRAGVLAGAATGFLLLVLAAVTASLLAYRLHRFVSEPITQLAAVARGIRPDPRGAPLPTIAAGNDEIGDLVRAFTDMLRRVQDASAEREQLLTREREASRLKDEFLATVSHELRTPLNAILGWAQILTTTTPGPETTSKALASIARNAKAQTRVIDDLIDVSRIVTGKLHIRLDPVDLRDVVDHAVDVIRATAQTKGIAVTMDLPPSACLVNGDRDRLQQVVWNLLSNAVKFTPPGGRVAVHLHESDHAFEIVVADTGTGISPAFLPHVFDRFRQADGSMTREHGGLGLGLAIVKELTELHGGSVRASSAGPHQGATFTVRLPQLAGLHADAAQPPPPTAEQPLALQGVRVLAVDDNEDAADVLADSLARSGARVRVATSGEAAIREWDLEAADVVICDLAMPVLDGFDVLRAIRQADSRAGRYTPIIALSAHASEEFRRKSHEAGFDRYVAKPCHPDELVQVVSHVLQRV